MKLQIIVNGTVTVERQSDTKEVIISAEDSALWDFLGDARANVHIVIKD